MKKNFFITILSFILSVVSLTSFESVSAQSIVSLSSIDKNNEIMKENQLLATENYRTWVWNTKEVIYDREVFLHNLLKENVNRIYLQINRDISMHDYRRFVQSATNHGISVYALEGSPKWLDNNNNRNLLFKKWIKKYQQRALQSQQFEGIHLDVEPYLNDIWDINQNKAIEKYQNILHQYKFFTERLDINFDVDIPFWFDGRFYKSDKYGEGRLSDWVIQNTDGVTIMAYRNFSEGNNGIIKLVSNELDFAESINKKVVIGVETKQSGIPYLSFYNSGHELMYNVFNEVTNHYMNMSSFDGFAIHSYEGLQALE
ncbi:hypothetical protein GCM10008986_10410 [Salinibacillus aidingensis]|uniref:Amidase n=1 Tax=Salinibacillus aidingensis TaxID=237684 RepID=A0ABN1AZ47_9BACI